MFLEYPGKIEKSAVLGGPRAILSPPVEIDGHKSLLIHGDNLPCMLSLLDNKDVAGKVDLVYIDPPFATNTVFRVGKTRTATISSSLSDKVAYTDTLMGSDFIEFIRQRAIVIRELLSPRGSLYLHIDYKIGHYVKIILDEVFGQGQFRNDISRLKCNPKNFERSGYGNVKDMVLFYTKTDDFIFHEPFVPQTESEIERLFPKIDAHGRRYTTIPLHAPGETVNGDTGKPWKGLMPPPGRHWRSSPAVLDELEAAGLIEWSSTGNPRKKIYAEDAEAKGKRVQDIWDYKDPQYPQYPTEKNSDMLRLILSVSSDPDSLVMDCFAGSGTTLLAACETGRQWIGIDQSDAAIDLIQKRLRQSGGGLFNTSYDYLLLEEATSTNCTEAVEKLSQTNG
ncbi:MAG: site-specific DNA-methyltransferase [Planctomycetaceae bacterium]|nr:MAG: site-specific DNA-methyltransferase [Planctomycetaceae bacterium]